MDVEASRAVSDAWIQTYSGRQFFLDEPFPRDVTEFDIAHALSMLCRYTGHTSRFYSVAEHCVLMSYAVPKSDALAALLHDATEAYVADISSPLKRLLPEYQAIEWTVWVAIARRFNLPSPDLPASVKDADLRILLTERRELLGPPPASWGLIESMTPLPVRITGWQPDQSRRLYLARLSDILGGRP